MSAFAAGKSLDREAFDRFLGLLGNWASKAGEPGATEGLVTKLRDDCRRFAEILRTAIETVDRRAELARSPADQAAYSAALARHLGNG